MAGVPFLGEYQEQVIWGPNFHLLWGRVGPPYCLSAQSEVSLGCQTPSYIFGSVGDTRLLPPVPHRSQWQVMGSQA